MVQPNRAQAVLITGSSTGIGAACALDLDRLGFRVFAGVRSEEAGQRLRQQASERLMPVMLDVTQQESICAAAALIQQHVGGHGLAGLVNNAGIAVVGPLEAVGIDHLRRQLEVNVVGQVAVIQAMLPMLRRAQGRIVNMGSVSGRVAAPYFGPYSASKHALEAISDSLRMELRKWGIRVSIIEPGSIDTPIWSKTRDVHEQWLAEIDTAVAARYADETESLRTASEHMAETSLPVEYVTRAVRHALVASRPRARYPVGRSACWMMFLAARIPSPLMDYFICRSLGLRKKPSPSTPLPQAGEVNQ